MRSGRPACWAAKPTTIVAAYVRATRAVMADQPASGGRCKRKRRNQRKTRPKKRSMLVRVPRSSAVHVGGQQERFVCRFGFQGTTATAPKVVWIQALSRSPHEPASRRTTRGRRPYRRTAPASSGWAQGASWPWAGARKERRGQPEPRHSRGWTRSPHQRGRASWGGACPRAASGSRRRPARIGALARIRSRPRMRCRCSARRRRTTRRVSHGGAPAGAPRRQCWEALGTHGRPVTSRGRPPAIARAGPATSQSCRSGDDRRHQVRRRASSRSDSALERRGRPPGPDGSGGGHRRWARRTASRPRATRCRCVTTLSALRCRADFRLACARWSAGGGTGVVLSYRAGTLG
jgi:hypothetical protein